jgi:histidinol-phosphate aminotransferase
MKRQHDVVRLAANENALGTSRLALEAVRRALEGLTDLHRYPDPAAIHLRERVARLHGVAIEQIVIGNGSGELIELAIRTFATPADHVVFAEPSFVGYRLAATFHRVPFTAVALDGSRHDLDAMLAAVTDKTRLVFVANPNNPTGTVVERRALEHFLRAVPPEVVVVIDEAYFHYVDDPGVVDATSLYHLRARLLVLRTFSKIYGLAALRVGYAVGPRALIDEVGRLRSPFNVGTLGQIAAAAALDDEEHVRRSRNLVIEERPRIARALGELGFDVAPSQASFVYAVVGPAASSLHEKLLRGGVLVNVVGSALRVTVGTSADNDRFLSTLAAALGS